METGLISSLCLYSTNTRMKLSIISSLAVVLLSHSAFSQTCLLPLDFGNYCPDFMTIKYYYNIDKDLCEAFDYNGCDGNANNFDTLADCELACVMYDQSPLQSNYPVDTYNPIDTNLIDTYNLIDTNPIDTNLPIDTYNPIDTNLPIDINLPIDTNQPIEARYPVDIRLPGNNRDLVDALRRILNDGAGGRSGGKDGSGGRGGGRGGSGGRGGGIRRPVNRRNRNDRWWVNLGRNNRSNTITDVVRRILKQFLDTGKNKKNSPKGKKRVVNSRVAKRPNRKNRKKIVNRKRRPNKKTNPIKIIYRSD